MYKDPQSPDSLLVRAFRHRAVRLSVALASGGLLLFVVFAVPQEVWTRSPLRSFAQVVITFAKWCIGILIALLVLRDVHSWFGTIRSLGRPSFPLCRHVYELTERAAFKTHAGLRARIVPFVVVSVALVIGWAITGLDILLWLLVFRLVFALHEPLDNGRPPAVLLLGASHREVIKLQAKIEMVARHNRVISLLSLSAAPENWLVHEWDIFRVPAQSNWEEMVCALESLTPIVVLDGRFPSEHVMWELQLMSDSRRMHKLIVVVAGRDGWPSAYNVPGLPSSRVCGPEQALALIHDMTRSRQSLPKPYNQ